ncbi:hypothetical protein E2C01_061970 [Portunus trituberculatus]|uniref:Uncharacterized protein n=1 Tax=Portunus trituberculatus TaxID=210409 RepID=A0A5B7HCT4_PORTR|nr:hypothetical protein [Portunus trituberculatus]
MKQVVTLRGSSRRACGGVELTGRCACVEVRHSPVLYPSWGVAETLWRRSVVLENVAARESNPGKT